MRNLQRIGLIDIGSNSVRLVIYEKTFASGHRVIDESKLTARLSEKMTADGRLPDREIAALAQTLTHFRKLCEANRTSRIRAVATAAIRNAANSREIARRLRRLTGLDIEILTGEEEARFGFLGMISSMDIRDGFLIDIGGGSTELSLFLDRKLIRSVSFPFGSVNTTKLFTQSGHMEPADMARILDMVDGSLARESWIAEHAGLPLIGLGGTIRSLSSITTRSTPKP
jgi:exopolyphosphatase/guanosine-5'-triphosphate,3'-diphosphate pyrophosphatase